MTDLNISFEFFPPKSGRMEERLWETIKKLEPLAPHFVSVTYGAGGSTRERTHRTVKRIVDDTPLRPAAHLTCVSASREEVIDVAVQYAHAGVRHIVALRGDPPAGMGTKFEPHPDGFQSSVELIEALRREHPSAPGRIFEVSVACYPERHPESRGFDADIALLKAKQDAGADRAITQFFFEPDVYCRFLDKARAGGVTMPIVPGIMLQPNFKGLKKMASLVQTDLPDWLHERYEGFDDDPETRDLITATVAADLCRALVDRGIVDFHFYTMNKSPLALSTSRLLGLKPAALRATG